MHVISDSPVNTSYSGMRSKVLDALVLLTPLQSQGANRFSVIWLITCELLAVSIWIDDISRKVKKTMRIITCQKLSTLRLELSCASLTAMVPRLNILIACVYPIAECLWYYWKREEKHEAICFIGADFVESSRIRRNVSTTQSWTMVALPYWKSMCVIKAGYSFYIMLWLVGSRYRVVYR